MASNKLTIVVRRSWTQLLNSKLFYWGFCLESVALFLWLNSLDSSLLIGVIKLFASIQAIGSFIVFIVCHTNVQVYGDWRGEKAAKFLRIHQKLDELRDDLLSGDEDKKQEYWNNLELRGDYSDFY